MPKFRKPGYTQIPNEIFDELMPELKGAQFKILCLIARRTLGYHRECFAMGVEKIADGTGLSEQGTLDAVKELEASGYIIRDRQFRAGNRPTASLYRLNIEEEDEAVQPPKNLGVLPPKNWGVEDTSTPQKFGGSTPQKFGGLNKEVKEKILKETTSDPHKEFASLSENQNPTPLPTLPDCPTWDAIEELESPAPKVPYRKNWRRPKEEKPHDKSDRLRQLRENEASGDPKQINATAPSLTTTQSRTAPAPTSPPQPSADAPRPKSAICFDELWAAYPAKGRTKKPASLEEYLKQVHSSTEHAVVMEGLRDLWIPSKNWAEGYIDHLENWLRNRRWEEEPEPAKPKYNDGYMNERDYVEPPPGKAEAEEKAWKAAYAAKHFKKKQVVA